MDHNLAAADTVKFNFLSFFIKNKIMSLIFFSTRYNISCSKSVIFLVKSIQKVSDNTGEDIILPKTGDI